MDDRTPLRKLWKAKVRFYGGLVIASFTSIFLFAGLSSEQVFPVIFGSIFVCFGILYCISGIVLWYKFSSRVNIAKKPTYYTPSSGLKRNNLDILYFRAEEHMNRGQFKDAVEIFNRALFLEPRFPAAWFGLARAWKCLQDYKEMVDAAREGLKVNPLDAEGLFLFGEGCIHLKEYTKARQVLTACLKVQPNNSLARQLLEDLEARLYRYF